MLPNTLCLTWRLSVFRSAWRLLPQAPMAELREFAAAAAICEAVTLHLGATR